MSTNILLLVGCLCLLVFVRRPFLGKKNKVEFSVCTFMSKILFSLV